MTIKAKVSDPDSNSLTLNWLQFNVGTYNGEVEITDADSASPSVIIPSDARSGETIHLVLTATDNGQPSLTKYHRTIITVK